jgi:hypothetical protein
MSGLFIWSALILIGLGSFRLCAKDLLWRWTQFRYRMVGLTPTRTAVWDQWTTTSGALLIGLGIAVFVFSP